MELHWLVEKEFPIMQGKRLAIRLDENLALIHVDKFPVAMLLAFEDETRGIAVEQNRGDFLNHDRPLHREPFENDKFLFCHCLYDKTNNDEKYKFFVC